MLPGRFCSAILLLLGACSQSDSSKRTESTRGEGIAAFYDKLESCGLGAAGSVGVGPAASDLENCHYACSAKASCETLDAVVCDRLPEPVELEECHASCSITHAFECSDGQLLQPWQVCDASADCSHGEDEAGCVGYSRFEDHFFCGDHSRISADAVCDGTRDCADLSDEENCAELKPTCAEGSEELRPSHVCDGRDDCVDGSDEKDCGWGEFTCDDGTVIGGHRRCDGHVDCPDGSDESGCAGIACPGDTSGRSAAENWRRPLS